MVVPQAVDHGGQSGVPSISSASAAMRAVSDSTCSRPISRSVRAPNSNPSPTAQHGVVVLLAEDEAPRGPVRQVAEVVDVLVVRRGGRRARPPPTRRGGRDRSRTPANPSRMNDACAAALGMAHWRTSSASTRAGSRFSRPAAQRVGHLAPAAAPPPQRPRPRRGCRGRTARTHRSPGRSWGSAARRRSRRSPPADPDGPGAGPGRCAAGPAPASDPVGPRGEALQPARRRRLPLGETVGGHVGQLPVPLGQPVEAGPDRLGLEVLAQELRHGARRTSSATAPMEQPFRRR